MTRRLRRRSLTLMVIVAMMSGLGALPAFADEPDQWPGVPGTPFSDGGGWIYNYVSKTDPYEFMDRDWDYPATTFQSITDKVTSGYYDDRGITNMIVYGPYASTGEYRGLPATGDFMDFDPANGTLEDWRTMVAAANSHGMTITVYLALPYIHETSPLFVKAQEDRRDGIGSWQANLLRWDERVPQGSNPAGPPPTSAQDPRPTAGNWAWSSVANRWYATAWNHPALNFAAPTTMDFAKEIIRFWMDNGVQGFEFDAPQSMWGLGPSNTANDARHTEFVNYPQQYRPDWQVYTHAEGLGTYSNQALLDRVGYTHIMVNPDDDFNSFVSRIGRYPQANTPDSLESHYRAFVDHRLLLGRGTYAPAVQDLVSMPDGLRALDLAVQGGDGVIVSIDQQILIDTLPADEVEDLFDVTRALDSSAAEAPSARRERIPTDTDPRAFAVLRRSVGGTESALNVFNFANTPACVTVNLANSGVTLPQRTTNLLTGEPGPWLRTTESTIKLPSYGWYYLDVDATAPVEWTLIDGAAAGWTYGGGWASIADPSAYGGSRHGGTAMGGFGEYSFTGSTVQGFARQISTGSQQVEVFVDGVSYGIHTQRRTGSGGPFQGTQLFSITGLTAGSHTLRIQQNNSPTGSAGASSIDYLRVAPTDYVAPTQLAGGDRCVGDTTPPQTDLTISPDAVAGSYIDPTLSLAAIDDMSGVATIEYALDGGDWTEYIDEIDVTESGPHSLAFRSTDVAGNVEGAQSVDFTVKDQTAPTVSISVSEPGSNGWHLADAAATITAIDTESGVDTIEYRVDGGDWQEYLVPVALPDGHTLFEARATDVDGNVSDIASENVKVDSEVPVSSASLDEDARTVTLRGADGTSGLEKLEYDDGDGWETYSGPISVGDGQVTVLYRAVDKAGNVETQNRIIVPAAGVELKDSIVLGVPTYDTRVYGTTNSINVRVVGFGGVPTGSVSVRSQGLEIAEGTLNSSGRITLFLPGTALDAGQHDLDIVYSGDAVFGSSSDQVSVTVTKVQATIAAKVVKMIIKRTTYPRIAVTVKPGEFADGTITVYAGSRVISDIPLVNGKVTVKLPKFIRKGNHRIKVVYVGSVNTTGASTYVTFKVK